MRLRPPDVAISHRLRPPPYGGSNQFLLALRGELERRGLRVSDGRLPRRARSVLLHAYLLEGEPPAGARVVHRVDGPIQLYRGADDGADRRIAELNRRHADATVFQSRYSLEAHRELGIELREPVVIPNAVDPAIFHPPREREPLAGRRVRVVATSWSDNPRKGGETYAWLATHVDRDRYELTFVGRASAPVQAEHVLEPLPSAELAEVLRRQDVYVTASLADPCSNALLEALACGLPALYVRSGGHHELVGDAGFGYDEREALPELLDRLAQELDERRAAIRVPKLGEVADGYLDALGLA
ncbi:MAG TPA: glycosyltransferase [Gaiellaceae bacterium]|jgi:glycosyltransferase involved in cell wall biosynthesis|nr:glycosyltransferase [Gaiellaceae bacterium]